MIAALFNDGGVVGEFVKPGDAIEVKEKSRELAKKARIPGFRRRERQGSPS